MRPAIALTILILAACVATAADWHQSLYLGNDGWWRQRIPIVIRNDMDRDAEGDAVIMPVGKGPGEADLEGARADDLRVCDAAGTEMLWSIADESGEMVIRGPIPAGATLTIPAEAPARETATYFAYFDNPAAWRVPDFFEGFAGVRNGGLERGEGDVPAGWRHDANDETHRTFWVTENPRSGDRCLKTVVSPGAEHTWIATRQRGIHIVGGARYVMRAWVRARDVDGYAGWYMHVGTADRPMMIAPMLSGGDGTYDWKEVSHEFTAPEEANVASLGTVLRGTGTAWFDDVSLECLDPPQLSATAGAVERLDLREVGADAPWPLDPAEDTRWDYRVPVRVMNLAEHDADGGLISVDLSGIAARLARRADVAHAHVMDGDRPVQAYRLKDTLLFDGQAPPRTVQTYHAYFPAAEGPVDAAPHQARPDQQADIPALPEAFEEWAAIGAGADYAALLESPRNLARNPVFTEGDALPDHWPGAAEGTRPAGTEMGLDPHGLFGERAARLHIPHDSRPAWTGWRQDVPVEPGRTYLFAAWLKCDDLRNGSLQLHAHYRNAQGELCESLQYASAGPAISGTTDWTLMSGVFTMPPDIATFQLHLTMLATGTAWHDGVVLAQVQSGSVGSLEPRAQDDLAGLAVWPVNAVVKVFRDDAPPHEAPPARLTAARNEKEPLQLAVRSPRAVDSVRVIVDPPLHESGARLDDLDIGVVGYVPIDHKTSYYSSRTPTWHRKFPTRPGSCDGWPGMWPDPILPRDTFDLTPDTTQPVWVTVGVPKDAPAGEYAGAVRLLAGDETLARTPFTVRVWDFTLPDASNVAAIYDVRQRGSAWQFPGRTEQETREQFWRFMAERRVSPDTIRPQPTLRYEDGRVIADFTDFDRAAEIYFDELKFRFAYTPWHFYLFGWGHPPGAKFGEAPYEGEHPYEDADRSKLRPEFKRAYQAALRVFWDHITERGWADRFVLYISDEPYDRHEHIREQMKALCDMIHEVNPDIPIYCSTWRHIPDWDGYLNVWGIGHYGAVPVSKIEELLAAGDRIWWTTDGQMCTDTPYCAVERLLPHYCFKYGAEAYEFWGIDWLTYDPYEFGWHSYIHQSGEPGDYFWVRYPNGDGYLAYPGAPIGHDGPVTSVRLEQAREGVEDYEYLHLLRSLVEEARAAGRDTTQAQAALALAADLVDIPNAGGRYSTRILTDPDALFRIKQALAEAIEGLR